MRVVVNGEPVEVPADSSIADLLLELGLSAPRVAVELNRDVVPRAAHAERRLRDGDRLEVVTFVGGGSPAAC